ncbi:hypothetical protein O5541_27450 [Escherichia coli]|nr:hypothetical protein [Escherichia coli]
MIETEQTIPERKDNPTRSSKTRNNSMNGFKNDMDDEKSLKEKDPQNIRTKHQKRNQNASWQCKSTTTPKPTA